jgi:hypothetical protein
MIFKKTFVNYKKMNCKSCNSQCSAFTAKTEKNYGRMFWSCPNRCKVFNGWVANDEKSHIEKPQPRLLNKQEPSYVRFQETEKPRLLKKQTPEYFCKMCEKKLDVEYEITHNIKRLNAYSVAGQIRAELKEDMQDGNYACEKCLNNE